MMPDAPARVGTGSTIGPYEVVGWIGAGGMGDVYRARDARLGRDVAIKLIAETFAADAGRVRRFELEARAAGQLNHPNILAVYDVGRHGGVPFIVSELLEGESLRSRLHAGALPARKAIDYARQIADGLGAAHDKGIVHRDIKPDNLFITTDGRIKILDFGIAKLSLPSDDEPRHTGLPTETGAGMVIGTAGYMSPEQIRGETVDARSDLFSVGTVLYEMLTGAPAFSRGSAPDTMAAILREDPPHLVSPAISPALARIVARCIEKTREMRFQSARDLAFGLEVLSGTAAAPVAAAQAGWLFRPLTWAAVATLVAAIAVTIVWDVRRPAAPSHVTRLTIVPPEAPPFASDRHMIALSPDGTQIVYVSTNRLFVRSMSELASKATAQGADDLQAVSEPVFSPDGRSIAFWASGDKTLKRASIAGGAIGTICATSGPSGMSWGPDGIVFGLGSQGIMRVSPELGSTPETIVSVKAGEAAHGPQMLPGGTHVLFTVATGTARDRWDNAQIVVQSLKTQQRKTVVIGGSDGRYIPTGHLVYAVSGIVYAMAFDVDRLEVRGEAVPVLEGVSRAAVALTGAANFTVSGNGSLAYIPGPLSASSFQLAVTDRKGVIELVNAPPAQYLFPRVSPDGTRVAYGTDDGKDAHIYTWSLSADGAPRRLTFDGNNRFPVWTSQSGRVVYQSDRGGEAALWQVNDASKPVRLTTPQPGESHEPHSWSPATDTLLFSVRRASDVSLWTYSFKTGSAARFGEVHSASFTETDAVFSPDGRWVAYTSNLGGKWRIYFQPFPANGDKHQLFARGTDDPHQPLWSADGKELFYVPRPGSFESVGIAMQPFAIGNPHAPAWWGVQGSRPFFLGPPSSRRSFDMMPNGRFLGLIFGAGGQTGAGPAPHIQVVLNWFEELKARVPGR